MRRHPVGVSVVTVDREGERLGLDGRLARIGRARASARRDLDRRQAALHELLRDAGGFGVSLLGADQDALAQHFARGRAADRALARDRDPRGDARRRCSTARSAGSSASSAASTRRATTRSSSAGRARRARARGPPLLRLGGEYGRRDRRVVFDLDGVVVDSEQVWDDVREQLVRERGGALARGRAGGDDGHELDRVVALHARRRSACPSRRRRSTTRSSGGCSSATGRAAADRRARSRRSSGWPAHGRSGSRRRRTAR